MGHPVERVDVCVVGAGICGLNALFVAAKHVGRRGSVALVDRRSTVGGMWNDTYDYVRLHQGHPMFTAGNIKWEWDKDPTYLATKPEVLGHLQHCLAVIARRTNLVDYLGWSYVSHEEAAGLVRTTVARGDETRVIESRKLVKAIGLNVAPMPPLPVTSQAVRSVSPNCWDPLGREVSESDSPVWIVGGGKTGMDTAHTLIKSDPNRSVNLIAGSGTLFTDREKMYPPNRWTQGIRPHAMVSALRVWDGTNDDELFDALRDLAGTQVTPTTRNWVSGILSATEARTIKDGLEHVVMGHLSDVVDDDGQPTLVLRSGERIAVPRGTWVVNCTGYLLTGDPEPYEPYTSPSGNVASINQRSATMLYSTYSGYFLTELLMRDKLHKVPLYELDEHTLQSKSNLGGFAAMIALVHNLSVMAWHLPAPVFLWAWGTNLDRLYPAPRWLAGSARFLATSRTDRKRAAKTLDTLGERFGVRAGPLAG